MVLSLASIDQVAEGTPELYCVGENWMYAALTREHHAYVLWGTPSDAAMDGLLGLFDASYGKMKAHTVLADLRDLELIRPSTFARFRDYMDARREALAGMVTNAVILVQDNLAGTVAAGFFGLLRAPFPFQLSQTTEDACQKLSTSAEMMAPFFDVKAALQGQVRERVRVHILANLIDPNVQSIAAALGMSERTLQRRLKEAGTSLSEEVVSCRIEQAKEDLRTTQKSVLTIALEVGFSTPEHFASSFRMVENCSPSEYRKRASR